VQEKLKLPAGISN